MNDNSIYSEIEPKNEKLKKLIKIYYLHSSLDSNYHQKISYYPNYYTSLNIYKESKVTCNELSRTHQYQKNNEIVKVLISKFEISREIIMKGSFNKITIIFNPLGLNHFLNVPLSSLTTNYCYLFNYFGEAFENVIKQVYEVESITKKRDLLDTFFCNNIVLFEESILTKAVERIIESSGLDTIQQIAADLKVSRKTLLRLFKKHLLYTPTEYKSIVKFRNTLNIYQNKLSKPSFSALAYEGKYYDQSDLNFNFKNRTGLTPKQLLSNIQTIVNGLYWTMDGVPKVQSSEKKKI